MTDFDRAFEIVVAKEGGFIDDPRDPGGKTKFGISDRADGKVDGKIDTDRDGTGDVAVEMLTIDQAKAIYKEHYWDKVQGDRFTWPLNVFLFDAAVNQGVGGAVLCLQKALGTPQTSVLDVKTIQRAQQASPWHCARFMAMRALRYQGTRNFDKFGEGWLTRTYSVAMEAK